jgi:hypothetical protein
MGLGSWATPPSCGNSNESFCLLAPQVTFLFCWMVKPLRHVVIGLNEVEMEAWQLCEAQAEASGSLSSGCG